MPSSSLATADKTVGKWLYDAARANPVLKVSAEILSFSGDELIWFLIPSVYISGGFATRFMAAARDGWATSASSVDVTGALGLHCLEEIGCSVFGTLGVCCSVECFFKLIWRRVRPEYAKQSASYVLPGEKFSFPSGHALRVFCLVHWLRSSHHSVALLRISSLPAQSVETPWLWVWAALVGWSRVAKGKHYPFDVVVGAAIGWAVGALLEGVVMSSYYTTARSGKVKVLGGVMLTTAWGLWYCVPQMQRAVNLRSLYVPAAIYFVFYLSFLVLTIPLSAATEDEWWSPASSACNR